MSTQGDQTMNLLNEAARRYPEAISFLAGRPPQAHVSALHAGAWLAHFIERTATSPNDEAIRWTDAGQYSDTSGTIRETAAEYLRRSGLPMATARACAVTNGAQEAFAMCLAGLVSRDGVAFTSDPCYIGFSGAARVLSIALECTADDGNFIDRLHERLVAGRPPVACVYVIPDFSNPGAQVMSLADRERLLALASTYEFTIIEDAAYRYYRFSGTALPTIKSLDRDGHVVYVESFAKTVLPGLRVAVMFADRQDAQGVTLADRLSWIKSYLSVATSPITQGMLAGLLMQQDYRLEHWVAPRVDEVRRNCERMCEALERELAPLRASGIAWRKPEGGFFLTIDLPFVFDTEGFLDCARDDGVLAMPMQLFSTMGRGCNQMRLAFSNVSPASIDAGVARLSRFIARRCEATRPEMRASPSPS